MATYRILSLDGGGIKGLFSIRALDRIVRRHPALLDHVDLLAGTSTGGIIALGLAAGKSPAEITELYRERGGEIFDDSLWDDLIDLGSAVGADYSLTGLRRELKRVFTGDLTLGDLDKRVLITSFDLDCPAAGGRPRMWKPKFFHNFPGDDSDAGEPVVDVALRTSAAPTYFPSHQGYIDGGIVANNPSVAAVAQALDARAAGRQLSDLLLLSISTGTEPKYIRGQRVNWGWGQWARPLVDIMIYGMAGVADFQCRQILGDRYFRVDTHFDRGVYLDDVSPRNLDYLESRADDLDLDGVLGWLDRNGW